MLQVDDGSNDSHAKDAHGEVCLEEVMLKRDEDDGTDIHTDLQRHTVQYHGRRSRPHVLYVIKFTILHLTAFAE